VILDSGVEDPAKKAHMSAIAVLQERTLRDVTAMGPLLARGDKGGLAAYVAAPATGVNTHAIVAVPLDNTGASSGQSRIIAQAAPDTSSLVVKHVTAGFLVAWTSLTDRGDSLNIVGTTDTGEPRASVLEIARTTDKIVWVEIIPTSKGAVCVWAEEPATGGGANVLAQALEASGRPRGVPSRAERGASSWQAVATNDGVGLAIVQSGALSLARLDTEGRVVGEPIPVAKNIGSDMDLVRAGNGYVFVWTDRARIDAQDVIAGIDAQNKVIAPHDALPDTGSSSLITIAGSDAGALLVWEPSHKRERATRRVNVGTLHDAASPLVTKTTLDLTGGASIEARALGDGWGILGSGRPCPIKPTPESSCGPAAPMFVKLDAALEAVQTEALVLGPAVSLAWGVECNKGGCLALAAGPDSPTTVYAVDLADRASTHAAPVSPALPDDAPRLASTSTIGTGAQVGDIATARVGDTTLVATIVSTGVDEKTHEERTALRVIVLAGKAPGAPITLSTKALFTGGVALVPGPGPKEATLAYVAKDGSGARVHVARIDDHGVKRADSALPGGAKGDASDVSLALVDGGTVVAWVDTRDGNGEVYAAKLGNDLTGAQTRITNAPGDATDTALLTLPCSRTAPDCSTGASVVLAWADPRESPRDGFADIYAIALSPKDGKPISKEGRVLSTAAHSRSPTLVRTPQGAALAWIEEAPAGAASEEAKGAMFALLDAHARPVRDPIKLKLRDEGIATAITLDMDTSTRLLHAVVARTVQDELWLDGARIPLDAGSVESYPLVSLDGPSSMDVALTLRGDELVFSDEGGAEDARLRRGVIVWKK